MLSFSSAKHSGYKQLYHRHCIGDIMAAESFNDNVLLLSMPPQCSHNQCP